jgi:hypothetical protein
VFTIDCSPRKLDPIWAASALHGEIFAAHHFCPARSQHAAHAQAVVFTFDQWARLSAGLQEIYISGAIDAVFTISVPAQAATAKFYNDYVVQKQIKARDIVEEMKLVVRSRPELYPISQLRVHYCRRWQSCVTRQIPD